MINCIKKEDAKTRNSFMATRKTKKQAKKEVEKDFQIQLLQEEFRINVVDFKTYFENLTRQVMNPYEDDKEEDDNIQFYLDEEDFVSDFVVGASSKIKIQKLINPFKNIDYIGDIDSRINTIKNQVQQPTQQSIENIQYIIVKEKIIRQQIQAKKQNWLSI
ncbi:unnamed protein product [Brachionus calyciflorus]|uniref:Uncharacterized protein n=1 Tax=Brachionus calyciflorus TaxID=104777 RepID=A0A814MH49_9BILA|nr:unnamed protein product [Brachionus calyciflorus]